MEQEGYLKPEHSLSNELAIAAKSSDQGRPLGKHRHKLRHALLSLRKLIRGARAEHEKKTGEKIVVEDPTPFLPDLDI
jgi:hypothetical protein